MKKVKILNIIIVFMLSFLAHNFYQMFPNIITSIFFPVNESIFEHMKIIATCYLLYSILEYYILKYMGLKVNNFLLSNIISIIVGIIFYLILFLPAHFLISRNMIVPIIILLITYIFMNYISYLLYKTKKLNLDLVSIVLIIILYLTFIFLTYCPPHIYLFYDTLKEGYGIIPK